MKILISPTQLEKFERCKHTEHMPIRLYVRKDHRGAGGYEAAESIKIQNPLYEPPKTADLEGGGIKKNFRSLKRAIKIGGNVAAAAAPVVALVAPQVALDLGLAAAATRAVLGDGAPVTEETVTRKRAKKQHRAKTESPRYVIAKKNKH